MLYLLYALFFISCILLVGSVLLQPGKTDAGALFTSNVSSTAFTPRGTASVLAKFTIGAAIVFMLSALMISMPAMSGSVSVLSGNQEEVETAPTPAAPEATPQGVQTVIGEGDSTVTFPADSNSNATVSNSAPDSNSPAANSNSGQTDPPSNQ